MNKPSIDDGITMLAPVSEQFDQPWANETLAQILADEPPTRSRWVVRHRSATVALGGVLTLTAGVGAAAATGALDPVTTVKETLLGFAAEPQTTGNDVGTIHDPQLVAQFERSNGDVFAYWIATTSEGRFCDVEAMGNWDGVSTPPISGYGCPTEVLDNTNPLLKQEMQTAEEVKQLLVPLERPDQLGGFMKGSGNLSEPEGDPILYGVSPFPGAVEVQVTGVGVDQTLTVRADSLGYGVSLPGATETPSLTLNFIDSDGRTLGTKTLFAPVG
jgi:hypothetical protein